MSDNYVKKIETYNCIDIFFTSNHCEQFFVDYIALNLSEIILNIEICAPMKSCLKQCNFERFYF